MVFLNQLVHLGTHWTASSFWLNGNAWLDGATRIVLGNCIACVSWIACGTSTLTLTGLVGGTAIFGSGVLDNTDSICGSNQLDVPINSGATGVDGLAKLGNPEAPWDLLRPMIVYVFTCNRSFEFHFKRNRCHFSAYVHKKKSPLALRLHTE